MALYDAVHVNFSGNMIIFSNLRSCKYIFVILRERGERGEGDAVLTNMIVHNEILINLFTGVLYQPSPTLKTGILKYHQTS